MNNYSNFKNINATDIIMHYISNLDLLESFQIINPLSLVSIVEVKQV
jgi:hypothetical protein